MLRPSTISAAMAAPVAAVWLAVLGATLSGGGALGCNAIFGITEGEGTGGSGASGTGTTGGSTGAGACVPERPAQCETQYLDDGDNCCVEGRNCDNGECVGGECLPALIAQGGNPEGISVLAVGDQLFWTAANDRTIYRTDADGDGKVAFTMPAQLPMEYTTRLAADTEADPEYLYFTDYGGVNIGRVPVGGGDPEIFATVPTAGNMARFGKILVHDDYVYWAMQRESYPTDPGRDIWRARRYPRPEVPVMAEMVIVDERPLGLAADEEYLYFGDSAENTISRVPWGDLEDEGVTLPFMNAEVLVEDAQQSPGNEVGELAVDDGYIYWGADNVLWAQDKNEPGGARVTIHQTSTLIGSIVADGESVYFAAIGDYGAIPGEVWRAPRADGSGLPTKLFQMAPVPGVPGARVSSITHDCEHVYFLGWDKPLVYKFTK